MDLVRSDNEVYYGLFERHNDLVDRWNDLNHYLVDAPPVGFPTRKKKRVLLSKGVILADLLRDFLEWYGDASRFLLHPRLVVRQDAEPDLTFLHYTNFLSHMISESNNNMVLVANNYHKRYQSFQSQINFWIAIASFVLTFVGLAATLMTIL